MARAVVSSKKIRAPSPGDLCVSTGHLHNGASIQIMNQVEWDIFRVSGRLSKPVGFGFGLGQLLALFSREMGQTARRGPKDRFWIRPLLGSFEP